MKDKNYSKWILGTVGFYETYTIHFNIPKTELTVNIDFSLLSSDDIYNPKLIISGVVQDGENPRKSFGVKEIYDMKEGVFASDAFFIRIKKNMLKDGKTEGCIKTENHSLKWDLKISRETGDPIFPKLFYKFKYPQSKLITPVLEGLFAGSIEVDGKDYSFNQVRGVQSHQWGTKRAEKYNWGYCNNFNNDINGSFEAFISRQKVVANFETPDISFFYLNYGGELYNFNQIELIPLRKNNYHIGYWQFSAETFSAKIEGRFEVEYRDLVATRLPDTDLSHMFSHSSSKAKLTIDFYKRVNWNYRKIDTLIADDSSVQFVTRYKDPHVNLLVD